MQVHDIPEDNANMARLYLNLYAFVKVLASPAIIVAAAVESINISRRTLQRAASKKTMLVEIICKLEDHGSGHSDAGLQ